MRSNELYGKKIGLLGYGRIGRKMANFSKAFEWACVHLTPMLKTLKILVTVHNSKISLLEECDTVSLHYHLNHETRNSFTKEDFESKKTMLFSKYSKRRTSR